MIQIQFDPKKLAGSILLQVEDLKDAGALAIRLGGASHPFWAYLNSQLSEDLKRQLTDYDSSTKFPELLQATIVAELNGVIEGPNIFDKKRFAGMLKRTVLLNALVKETLSGDDLKCLNRCLLEEACGEELARSPKAEWEAWNILAHAATRRVIDAWEEWKDERERLYKSGERKIPEFDPPLDDDIWKGFRDWLLENVFHNKCAYCETEIVGFIGDAEHFRPKGRLRSMSKEGKTQIVRIFDEDGNQIDHPGYFWLAYHWQNLLPSCHLCNRYGGKKDLFPVEKENVAVKRLTDDEIQNLIDQITESPRTDSVFYMEPRDLDVYEGRMLLHPFFDNPENDLYFKLDGTAEAWPTSTRGRPSITVYDLNEPVKVKARRKAQVDGLKRYFTKLAALEDKEIEELDKPKRIARNFREEYYQGSRPYAVAVFDYIHDRLEGTDFDPDRLLAPRRQ